MSSLPNKSNIVLDHRYFLGNFRDFSGNANHGTPTGCSWEHRKTDMVRFNSTDVITVADSPELQFTDFTLIV